MSSVSTALDLKECYLTNRKCIISGNVLEFYQYEKSLGIGFSKSSSTGRKKLDGSSMKRSDNLNKTKNNLRRLINSNVTKRSKFVTLTFAENLTDVKRAKLLFKNFIKRLNYIRSKDNLENLKYIYVVEFQKRGAVHFHCIFFNLDFFKVDYFSKIWGNGFCKINKIDNVDNVGAYVVKYMQKDLQDGRLSSCDLYGRSRSNLKEPVIVNKPQEVVAILEAYKHIPISYNSIYDTDYNGVCSYSQIKLPKFDC